MSRPTLLPIGSRVLVNDANHVGTVRAAFVADLSRDDVGRSRSGTPDVYYVVSLEVGQWIGGDSCATGWAYLRELVAHGDSLELAPDPRHDRRDGRGFEYHD